MRATLSLPSRPRALRHFCSNRGNGADTGHKRQVFVDAVKYARFKEGWEAEQKQQQLPLPQQIEQLKQKLDELQQKAATETQPVFKYAWSKQLLLTFSTVAAVTPLVLVLPVLGPMVLSESIATFLGANGCFDAEGLQLPFWTSRAALSLVAHPSITLVCITFSGRLVASSKLCCFVV